MPPWLSCVSFTQFAVAWQRLRQLQEEDATLEALVMSVNRGGLLVEAASLRGFIPTSHVSVVRVLSQVAQGRQMIVVLACMAQAVRMEFCYVSVSIGQSSMLSAE